MLTPIITLDDGAAVAYLDVVDGQVVGVSVVNSVPVAVSVQTPGKAVLGVTLDPGETAVSLPKGKQFAYGDEGPVDDPAVGWSVSLTTGV